MVGVVVGVLFNVKVDVVVDVFVYGDRRIVFVGCVDIDGVEI